MQKRFTLIKKLKPVLKQSSLEKCNDMFNDLCDFIVKHLKEGNQIRLPHIGIFFVETKPPCSKRNPKTGEMIEVPERKRVRFRPAKSLNNLLNE